jgi:hypothetical protein
LFATPQEINSYYAQLKLVGKLDNSGTPDVYILDKRNLRGRKKKIIRRDTVRPAELSNEMLDDFKVILYEYRAALKKNHNATKQL